MCEDRRLLVPPLVSLEGQGSGSLGGGGAKGGVQDPFLGFSSTIRGSALPEQLRPHFHQGASSRGGGEGSVAERGNGASASFSGVLQPHLRRDEGLRSLAPHHRPVVSQQVCDGDQVPDGNRPVGSVVCQAGRLDGFSGLEGCLPSSPYPSGQSTLPPVLHLGGGVPVQGSMLWAKDVSTGLHAGDGSGFGHPAQSRYSHAAISRRLASASRIRRRVSSRKGYRSKPLRGAGHNCESRQIPISTDSDCDLSGDGPQVHLFEGFSNPREGIESLDVNRGLLVLRRAAGVPLEVSVGTPSFANPADPGWQAQDEVAPTGTEEAVELPRRGVPSFLEQPDPPGSQVVARGRAPHPWLSSSASVSRRHVLVRRFRRRLGRPFSGRSGSRHLVRTGEDPIHQSSGAEGYSSWSSSLPRSPGGPDNSGLLRQLDGSSLPEETGRHDFSCSQRGGTVDPEVGGRSADFPETVLYSWEAQRPGGFPLSSESGCRFRVDLSPGRSGQASQEMAGERRSLRHSHQLSASRIFRSSQRSPECGNGRLSTNLGPSPGLRLSSLRSCSPGPQQVEGFGRSGDDADRSVLATEGVVPGPAGVLAGATPSVARTERSSQTAPLPSVPSGAPFASTSCLETIQRFARHEGFSRRVAEQISFARRRSTRLVYQAKWDKYRKWCRDKGCSISRPTIAKVADFLLFLFEDLHLSVPCIRGYRSMLALVFRWKLPEISDSPALRDLIRSFVVQRPRFPVSPPNWDLSLVLAYLRSPPFEPLGEATFRNLTIKTLFLLSLATARRVGELQAISSRVAWLGGDASLSYLPEFVAKTESDTNPIPRSFVVKSLKDFAGNLREDYLLCPVRAIKFYLQATSDISPRPRSLFVSPRCRQRSLSKNALSFFLRDCISGAGALRADVGQTLRAHSIRGLSTSLSFTKNWSVKQVLSAATWSSNTVFSSFYLKDVAYEWDNCRSLGPFIAAGQIFNSPGQQERPLT